jgi:hypothetical protein
LEGLENTYWLGTTSVPWTDAQGAARLTVVAKGVFLLGEGGATGLSGEAIARAELDEAWSAASVPRLSSDEPETKLELGDFGLLAVGRTSAGPARRLWSIPHTVEALLVAKSGARLALPLRLYAVRLHPGAARVSLSFRGLASVREDELEGIYVAAPASARSPSVEEVRSPIPPGGAAFEPHDEPAAPPRPDLIAEGPKADARPSARTRFDDVARSPR